jgi:hypothetical protein
METGSDAASPAILTCWKDIARYMGKGVRTVQRWEQKFGLPVHRPLGVTHKSSVVAHPHDLDAWLEVRWSDRARRSNGVVENGAVAPPIADPSPVNSLSSGIRTSHELRAANHALVKEIATVLHSLVQSCDQLVANRQQYVPNRPSTE